MSTIVRSAVPMPYAERISFGFTASHEMQIEEVTLGGGYEYAYLNSSAPQSQVVESYDLTWKPLNKTEATNLLGTLTWNVINWIPDFSLGTENWLLKGAVSVTQIAANTYQVSATLRSYHTNISLETGVL